MVLNMLAAFIMVSSFLFLVLAITALFFIKEKETDLLTSFDPTVISNAVNGEGLAEHAAGFACLNAISNDYKWIKTPDATLQQAKNIISTTHKNLSIDVSKGIAVPSAAEWLLDNHYILKEQIEGIKKALWCDLPSPLPVIVSGPLKGYTRIQTIATDMIYRTGGNIDEKTIMAYVNAYQTRVTLNESELAMLPCMIKLALIEQIASACLIIDEILNSWKHADECVDTMQKSEFKEKDLLHFFPKGTHPDPSFIERLFYLLRKFDESFIPKRAMIEKILDKNNITLEAITHSAHTSQSSATVVIGSCIMSLRQMSAFEWDEAIEDLSALEKKLKEDPNHSYGKMDSDSRAQYRLEISRIAGRCDVAEMHVVKTILDLARKAGDSPSSSHVGFYLFDKGRALLRRELGYHESFKEMIYSKCKLHPLAFYLACVLIATILIYIIPAWWYQHNLMAYGFYWTSLIALLLAAIPITNASVYLTNRVVSSLFKPHPLLRMDFSEHIPEEYSTLIAIPSLMPDKEKAAEMIERLETHYLSNHHDHVYYLLMGDFKDSNTQAIPEDEEIINKCMEGIAALNEKYCSPEKPQFIYFHRNRTFNDKQGKWIGYERKRGSLSMLNQLLSTMNTDGTISSSFFEIRSLDTLPFQYIKYVITLDADTLMPHNTVHRLVGVMAHPLNKPILNEKGTRVMRGYSLLQPRVICDAESAGATPFATIFTGDAGMDMYTGAISDVYQDLFGEGIFTGKGIYDLQVFHTVMGKVIPEDTVLSHDLLEGSYVRAGLDTGTIFVDNYPSSYGSSSTRLHRWIRGDWQLIHWLKRRIPSPDGKKIPNPLSTSGQWKILDNLRRSLMAPATFALMLVSFITNDGGWWFWSLIAMLLYVFPLLASIIKSLFNQILHPFSFKHRDYAPGGTNDFLQAVMMIVFLPHQAWLMIDAITKTLTRIMFTHRNLLEWVTAAEAEKNSKGTIKGYFNAMRMPLFIALVWGALVFMIQRFMPTHASMYRGVLFSPNSIMAISGYVFLLIFWYSAPYVAHYTGKPYPKPISYLTKDQITSLRLDARKIWRFFEDLASQRNSYIPPDNLQEEPPRGVAARTSPTNIGLGLLANLSSYDLGYSSPCRVTALCENTFNTIEKMEKWNGHLLNWYQTTDLKPLKPRYVSTVDSGNFICCLIALKEGLSALTDVPKVQKNFIQGLRDTLKISGINISSTETYLDKLEIIADHANDSSNSGSYTTLLHEWESGLNNLYNLLDQCNDSGIWISKTKDQIKDLLIFAKCEYSYINHTINELCLRIDNIVNETTFKPLYSVKRQLLSIGFDLEDGKLTNSYYDLLASEARQASFIGIALGDIPVKHWSRLGRTQTAYHGRKGLVSWTGTMFEYLMPTLLMKTYRNTLLDEACHFAVMSQRHTGEVKNLPWGISECAFFMVDANKDYQYKAMGIPELGLKRGLTKDYVISPYSVFLAMEFNPLDTSNNLERLKKEGLEGAFGYYESVDYTRERLPMGRSKGIVKSFMAHHEGMSLLSVSNFLTGYKMQERFHGSAIVKSADLLLHEKIPYGPVKQSKQYEKYKPLKENILTQSKDRGSVRIFNKSSLLPKVHFLTNGDYCVMVTDHGDGFSRIGDRYLTRWKAEQPDEHGVRIYLRDLSTNAYWEGCDPDSEKFEGIFTAGKAKFRQVNSYWESIYNISVLPDENVEMRTITIKNRSKSTQSIEVTSYMETTIAALSDDSAHQSFSSLFLQTSYDEENNILYAARKPRVSKENSTAEEDWFWLGMTCIAEGKKIGRTDIETDRFRFIGRGGMPSNPLALSKNIPLSGSVGSVIDPALCMRNILSVAPGQTAKLTFLITAAANKYAVKKLLTRLSNPQSIKTGFRMASESGRLENSYLSAKADEVEKWLDIASYIVLNNPIFNANDMYVRENTKGQSGLWAYGISGDLPIITATIEKNLSGIKEIAKAHEFWRKKGLLTDLVILIDEKGDYLRPVYDSVQEIILSGHGGDLFGKKGGIHILSKGNMSQEDEILILACSKLVFKQGIMNIRDITDQNVSANANKKVPSKADIENKIISAQNPSAIDFSIEHLTFYNGYGGFNTENNEYEIHLQGDASTPLPWSHIVANPTMGFLCTESGSGYTWHTNSREFKLTPWSNDPISDPAGEFIFLHDLSKDIYYPLLPYHAYRNPNAKWKIIYGMGYAVYEGECNGITHKVTQYVPIDNHVKVTLIEANTQNHDQFEVVSLIQPVLGVDLSKTSMHLKAMYSDKGWVTVQNNYNSEFSYLQAYTGLGHHPKSNIDGMNVFDGMIVMASPLPANMKMTLLIGASGEGSADYENVFESFLNPEHAIQVLNDTKQKWKDIIKTVKVQTPDESFNIMMNGWLVYQTMVCRLNARTAFYQAGGAIGFRDQLQDSISMIQIDPELCRKQILYNSSRQFPEGDVQHWWHPPEGKGTRTRISDDLLWLPYAVSTYINATGRRDILNEMVPFIDAPVLGEEEHERYVAPVTSSDEASVYEHCIRAIRRVCRRGRHGLPIIGCGDWNDGMNMIGVCGMGESVWLGWFLIRVLTDFAPLCEEFNDTGLAEEFRNIAKEVSQSIEENAWDGNWYLRAWFDNGTPLGSIQNDECRIDAISQSWSVISGAGDTERVETAMQSLESRLVDYENGLIRLLEPPFDTGSLDPGYIKGYLPGVRENGGQYSHAAVWSILAFAMLGDKGNNEYYNKAWNLFNLINPVNHARTDAECMKYKGEPYVMAADVYSIHPNAGRAGWTWYTGSSGWMYRAGIEFLLGVRRCGDRLVIEPRLPSYWNECSVEYQFGNTCYNIMIRRSENKQILVDGTKVDEVILNSDKSFVTVEVYV